MAARDPLIEHLLRRIGFGAGPGDVEQLRRSSATPTALDRLINYESIFDDVDDLIGEPGYVALTVTGRLCAREQHRACAAALAVPDGPHASVRSRRR